MLEVCGSSLLWRFLTRVGLDEWLVRVSCLVKLALVFWWVELDIFFMSTMKCPVVSFDVSMGLI